MDPDRFVSASDLADYAYCPRSHYYRHHPPAGGPTPGSVDRSRTGTRYHERELGAERRRDRHASGYAAALAVGCLVAAGGVAWLLLR